MCAPVQSLLRIIPGEARGASPKLPGASRRLASPLQAALPGPSESPNTFISQTSPGSPGNCPEGRATPPGAWAEHKATKPRKQPEAAPPSRRPTFLPDNGSLGNPRNEEARGLPNPLPSTRIKACPLQACSPAPCSPRPSLAPGPWAGPVPSQAAALRL